VPADQPRSPIHPIGGPTSESIDQADPAVLARSTSNRGEVVLRRRGLGDDEVDELIVNGAFAMDSAETSSERQLARLAAELSPAGGRMLIGGLGLGYTAYEALGLELGGIDVVELEGAIVDWARAGVTSILGRLAVEPRVHLAVGNVAEVLGRAGARRWNAIALDVDNGPDFLIHAENASLYHPDLLRLAYERLAPGGRLAIWCQGPSPELMQRLRTIGDTAREHLFSVQRGQRRFSYAICTLDRPLACRPVPADSPGAPE
jgi:spermidine synthase